MIIVLQSSNHEPWSNVRVRENNYFQINLRECKNIRATCEKLNISLEVNTKRICSFHFSSYSTIKDRSPYLEKERTLILSLWTCWPEPVRKWASFNSGHQVAKGQRLLQEVRNLFMGLHTVCTLALCNTNRNVTNATMVLWILHDCKDRRRAWMK